MGTLNVKLVSGQKSQHENTKSILRDLKAMEKMLEAGWFNKEPIHIGAEQELCLVDKFHKPMPISLEVLERLQDKDFTTELAKFNLEINLQPLVFTGRCFSDLLHHLEQKFEKLTALGESMGFRSVITGILPTLRKTDFEMDNMTPLPRYHALMKAIEKVRGKNAELKIQGIDELNIKHDSALLEACNTSFQVHLQVKPEDFVCKYNIAMAITGPVLSIASNSPYLFGKRLWSETRVALFQQSIDTRTAEEHLRDRSPRVMFGKHWVSHSPVEIYQEDVVRFRPMLMADPEHDVLEQIEQGITPALRSLMIHNSTVYRWNRPCYGISPDGKPHLRIENRALPAGPSLIDEVANAAFWLGLVEGFCEVYSDVTQHMPFDDARSNFTAAAFAGHEAEFTWMGGKKLRASELISKELLPLARVGLEKRGVDAGDIDQFLQIIEERNASRQTGAQWILDSCHQMGKTVKADERAAALTAAMVREQASGKPVHTWALATHDASLKWSPDSLLIEEFMTRDVFTVQKEDIPELVANIMDWQQIRFVPVEDQKGRLVGLMSVRTLIRYLLDKAQDEKLPAQTVESLMDKKPVTIAPEQTVVEALRIMQQQQVACLPVVKNDKLVGIISEGNFMNVTTSLLNLLGNQSANNSEE